MDKLSLKELFAIYKRWVINNPRVVTDVETVATWSSYFVVGKACKSPVVSELVYSVSKLLSLFNDRLLREAYGHEDSHYSLKDQIKHCLTIIHYCEVFMELIIKERWGQRGKWTVAALLQTFKCCSALILLYRYREVPIPHPPIAALQRKVLTEETDHNANSYFTLRRSGRLVRCVDGAPPVAFRDWQPVKIQGNQQMPAGELKELMSAETLHILKPLIHLAAMRAFGSKGWRQWMVSLFIDLASMNLYSKHIRNLSQEQKLELSRRKLSFVLYLLRDPMYSKVAIEGMLDSVSRKMPMVSFICGPLIQYLSHWQDIYFYMWSS